MFSKLSENFTVRARNWIPLFPLFANWAVAITNTIGTFYSLCYNALKPVITFNGRHLVTANLTFLHRTAMKCAKFDYKEIVIIYHLLFLPSWRKTYFLERPLLFVSTLKAFFCIIFQQFFSIWFGFAKGHWRKLFLGGHLWCLLNLYLTKKICNFDSAAFFVTPDYWHYNFCNSGSLEIPVEL